MSDDALNPNFEWKKKSFDKKERLSRRIDTNQALLFEEKKKNDFSQALSITSGMSESNINMNKLRKKIKEALDEEDDDDGWIFDALNLFNFDEELGLNSLFQPLSNSERNAIKQQKTANEMKMQQNAAKTTALNAINALAKKNGLTPLSASDIAENMQSNTWGNETFKQALERNLAPDIKISSVKPDDEKVLKLVKGLKRLKKLGAVSAIEGLEANEIIQITDSRNDDNKVAKMLLKKTGRTINSDKKLKLKKQKHPPKVSFKKLLQSRQDNVSKKV